MVFWSQVVSADSGCCKVLGFLPRELAQYLSPLIEKYRLSFEVIYFRSFYAYLSTCFKISRSIFSIT